MSNARDMPGGGMLKLRFDRYIKSVLEASLNFTYVATVTLHHIDNGVLQIMRKVMERVSPADFLSF